MSVLLIVAGAALVWLLSLGFGAWAMRRFETRLAPLDAWLFRFLVGSALASASLFVLCLVRLATLPVFLLLGLAAAALLVQAGLPRGPQWPAVDWRWPFLFWTLYAAYSYLYLPHALTPEISPDAAGYHLGEVRRYLAAHGFGVPITNWYQAFSQGLEMLFLPAYAVGRHSAAKLVHWAFLQMLPLLLYSFGRRTRNSTAGVVAAIWVFISPVVGVAGTTAYVDVAFAAVAFGLFSLLELWRAQAADGEGDDRLLWPVGLLAGFAYGIKAPGLVAVVYALLVVFWYRRHWRPLAIVVTAALLTGGIWMARNIILFHNPLAPFANTVFPNAWFTPDMEESLREGLGHKRESGILGTLNDVLLTGSRSQSVVGPAFALLPLALLAARRALLWRALAAGLLFGLGYAGNTGARFLLPALPFCGLAIGLGLAAVPRLAQVLVLVAAYLCWPSIFPRYFENGGFRVVRLPWAVALRRVDEQVYLREKCPECRHAFEIEENTPANARIFSFVALYDAYYSRMQYTGWMSAYGSRADELLKLPLEWGLQPRRRIVRQFPRQALQAVRLVQTVPGPDPFSVSELELRDGETPVPFARATASHMPAEAFLAIDGVPNTRWRAHHSMAPGQWFTAQLREPHPADCVTILLTLDQGKVRLALEGQDAQGQWHPLESTGGTEDQLPAPPDLRPQAAAQLRRLGFTHLVLRGDDYYSADYRTRAAEWGLTLVFSSDNFYLYRLP